MEALAVLRLSALSKRHNCGQGYLEDDEVELETPYTSAPSSPRRAFDEADEEEEPLGEVRAAVPFVWELVPGKPKGELGSAEVFGSSDEAEDSGRQGRSPGGSETTESSLSRDSSNTEFEFSSRFTGVVEPSLLPCRTAEELFSKGQLLPLRLPPRLQGVKNLRSLDVSPCSDSSVYSSGSFRSYLSPRSPWIAGSPKPMKSVSLCRFTKTAEEAAVLGKQELRALQRPRSLTPLRLFNGESSAPGSNLSSDSTSSSSSSSSSKSGDSQAESEENGQASALKDLKLFTDMAMASMRSEDLKMDATSRVIQSRRELLKKQQEQWYGFADAEKVDTATSPALAGTRGRSRSNARSRPSIDAQVKSSQKENVASAIFASRFGMLCSCMGMALPESP